MRRGFSCNGSNWQYNWMAEMKGKKRKPQSEIDTLKCKHDHI